MFFLKTILIIFYLLIMPCAVFATAVDYSVGLKVTKYDNLNLVQNPVQGETAESVKGTINIAENTAELVANIDASLEVINYRNEQADDENLGNVVANLLWTITPGHYEWYISNVYTQILSDSYNSNTPTNRLNANAFSTGPNFVFRVNSRNKVNIDGRVEKIIFESSQNVTDTDNKRATFSTSWEHQLRSVSSISLNYTSEMVDYDDDINNTDFDRNDLFVYFNYRRGISTFEADIGVAHIDNSNLPDIDETRYRFSFLNARTRTSSIEFELDRNITDTSTELLNQAPGPTLSTGFENNVSDIFLEKTLSIRYNKTLRSGNFSVDASKTTNDYQRQIQLDQIEKAVLITGIWNVQRSARFQLTAQYIKSVFDNISREDDDYLYSLLYTYNARRHITVGIEASTEERISSNSLNDYNDTKLFLSLTYSTR